jgi:hypothetical protein
LKSIEEQKGKKVSQKDLWNTMKYTNTHTHTQEFQKKRRGAKEYLNYALKLLKFVGQVFTFKKLKKFRLG